MTVIRVPTPGIFAEGVVTSADPAAAPESSVVATVAAEEVLHVAVESANEETPSSGGNPRNSCPKECTPDATRTCVVGRRFGGIGESSKL